MEAFSSIVQPKLIATDRELALMNAISIVFPSARHILCMWHINKNVLAHTKRFFPVQEDFDSFMEHWTGCVYSNSEEDFKAQWHLMKTLSGSSGWQSAVSYGLWGLPCKHQIRLLVDSDGILDRARDIHRQWWLDKTLFPQDPHDVILEDSGPQAQEMQDTPPCPRTAALDLVRQRLFEGNLSTSLVLASNIPQLLSVALRNPVPVTKKRGRPTGAKNKSTKRDKSYFEHVEGRKCSNCQKPGHNARTCQE